MLLRVIDWIMIRHVMQIRVVLIVLLNSSVEKKIL